MTPELIIQLVMTFGIIPGLFVWLLFHTINEHKKDKELSQGREEKLMEHQSQLNKTIERNTTILEKLEMRTERIERQLDIK